MNASAAQGHSLGQRLLFLLAGQLGRWLIGLYFLTIRIRSTPEAKRMMREWRPGVYAFWHAHQLAAVWHMRYRRAGILISASKDGEYIARVAESLGYRPIRGSSSRGGTAALAEIIRRVREGGAVGITPDGPRGPRYTVHPGALVAAQRSGTAVVPFTVGLSDYWELPSWDRFRIPKPFSSGVFHVGEPLAVPQEADAARISELSEVLRARLMSLEKEADAMARARRSCACGRGR